MTAPQVSTASSADPVCDCSVGAEWVKAVAGIELASQLTLSVEPAGHRGSQECKRRQPSVRGGAVATEEGTGRCHAAGFDGG